MSVCAHLCTLCLLSEISPFVTRNSWVLWAYSPSSAGITWELVRNAIYLTPSRATESKSLLKVNRGFICTLNEKMTCPQNTSLKLTWKYQHCCPQSVWRSSSTAAFKWSNSQSSTHWYLMVINTSQKVLHYFLCSLDQNT